MLDLGSSFIAACVFWVQVSLACAFARVFLMEHVFWARSDLAFVCLGLGLIKRVRVAALA